MKLNWDNFTVTLKWKKKLRKKANLVRKRKSGLETFQRFSYQDYQKTSLVGLQNIGFRYSLLY